MTHLTSSQIYQYQRGELAPADLLAVDDHLASCQSCRSLLHPAPIVELLAQLSSPHLTYEQLESAVDANRPPAHLDICSQCRAEYDDLKSFRASLQEPKTNYKIYLAIAAALVAGIFIGNRPESLPPEVARQLETGQIMLPPALAALRRPIGQQRALPTAHIGFHLLFPMGQAVQSPTPTFRWQALPGATSYTLTVYHQDFRERLTQSGIRATAWTPAQPLEPDITFLWTVQAETPAGTVTAPASIDPEALFRIHQFEPKSRIPLVRANEYLNAGLVTEAVAEVSAHQKADPANPRAAELKRSIDRLAQYPIPSTEKPAQ